MSILDTTKIDMIGVPHPDSTSVILGIADHLPWDQENSEEHLIFLQEKINAYLRFIERGEIYGAFPSARDKSPVIRVIGQFVMSRDAKDFFTKARERLSAAGIKLEFVHSP